MFPQRNCYSEIDCVNRSIQAFKIRREEIQAGVGILRAPNPPPPLPSYETMLLCVCMTVITYYTNH